jgi:hypothetical protein
MSMNREELCLGQNISSHFRGKFIARNFLKNGEFFGERENETFAKDLQKRQNTGRPVPVLAEKTVY